MTVIRTATSLFLLIAAPLGTQAGEIVLSVPGIPGPYCAYGIEKRLLEITGVRRVDLSWQQERITVTVEDDSSITSADIENAVAKSDYPYDYSVIVNK